MRTLDEESRLSSRVREPRFVLSLAQAAPVRVRPSLDRPLEARLAILRLRGRPSEAARNRFIARVYASRGRPRLVHPHRSSSFLPSFLRVGWREVLGSANCDVNHRGHYALLLVLPLQKSDGGTPFHCIGHASSSVVVGLGRRGAAPFLLHLMETAI